MKARPGSTHRFDPQRFRELFVDLTPAVGFRMLEVICPPRGTHGASVWPTSIALSQWLLSRPREWFAESAIEIGGGLGLVSLTLAHLEVLIECTDRDPVALLLAAEAAEFNLLRGFSTGHLDWSEPGGPNTSLLIGADVLYENNSPELLFGLIHEASMLRPLGALVLAGPGRRSHLLDELVGELKRVGYSHESVELPVDWQGRTDEIAIHTLHRK